MKKRIISLVLALLMILPLLPVTAFAAEAEQTGTAALTGFTAGGNAGAVSIQNNGMAIMAVPSGVDGNNPMFGDSKVGQTATLSPYCPPSTLEKYEPEYVYNDYVTTAIIVADTGRRLQKVDTFQPGMTYRFTFQDTSWPVSDIIKGGGYLGELTKENFTIEDGAEVVRVERVNQQIYQNGVEDAKQGFFYNVWIKIDGTQKDYAVQYASNNVTVTGLSRPDTSTAVAKTGYAKEGDRITLTADKAKSGYFFTGWKFTTTDDNKFYTNKDYIRWYCNVMDYTSNESGSSEVTCSFRMGDKPLHVEAVYSNTGNVTFNSVNLNITQPIKGGPPFTTVEPVYDSAIGTAYQVDRYKWYDTPSGLASGQPMQSTSTFTSGSGKYYALTVTLKLNDRYVFDTKNPTVTINGQEYTVDANDTVGYRLNKGLSVGSHPVSYWYFDGTDSGSKSIVLTIPLKADANAYEYDWLRDHSNGKIFEEYAALKLADPPSIDSVTVTDAGGHSYGTPQTASDFTMALEQGINYSVNVKVRVPKAIQTSIDKNLMQLLPQSQYLVKEPNMDPNLWQGSQVKTEKDGSDTIYIYSTKFSPVAGENYMLTFGTNLMTTGADAQLIATNAIFGRFNGIAAKISTVNIQLNRPVDTKDIADNTLPSCTFAGGDYGVGELTSQTSEQWTESTGEAYRKKLVLTAEPGYKFANDVSVTFNEGVDVVEQSISNSADGEYSYLNLTIKVTPKKLLQDITGIVDGLANGKQWNEVKIDSKNAEIKLQAVYTRVSGGLQLITEPTIDGSETYCVFVSVTPKDGYVIRGKCTVELAKQGKLGFSTRIAELTRYDRTTEQVLHLGEGRVGQYYGLISLATSTPQKLGDLNWDGSVNVSDVQALYEYLTQGIVPTAGENACDLNKDGSIDVYDLQYLYELVIGLI